jgi:hypothetical protein
MTQTRQTNGIRDATRRPSSALLEVAVLAVAAVGLALLGLAGPARADHTWEVTITVNGYPTYHKVGDPAWERTINVAQIWDGPHLDFASPAPFPNNYYREGAHVSPKWNVFGPPSTVVTVTWKTTKSLKNLGCKWVLGGSSGLDFENAKLKPDEKQNLLQATVPVKMQIAGLYNLSKAVGGHTFAPQCEGPKPVWHQALAALWYNLSPGLIDLVYWYWSSKFGWQEVLKIRFPSDMIIGPDSEFHKLSPGLYRAYARAAQDKAKGITRFFCVSDPRQCEASMKQAKDAALSEAVKKLGPVAPPKK